MDKQTEESHTINKIDLEILKKRLLNVDFVSLYQRISNILRSAVAVHIWSLNTAQNFLVWSDREFALCPFVLSVEVGGKKCFIDRYRCAEQATILEIPLFYKCHIGFSCGSIHLISHHHYSVVLTVGPFHIEEKEDVLYFNVINNLKELKLNIPENEMESLKFLPYHSIDSVKEVMFWMKENFQFHWNRLFPEGTGKQTEIDDKKYRVKEREEDVKDINQYIENFDKVRKQMLLIALQMENKQFAEFVLRGKGEELNIQRKNLAKAKFSLYTWVMNILSSFLLEGSENNPINKHKLFFVKDKLFLEDKTLRVFIKKLIRDIFAFVTNNFKKENQKERFAKFYSVLEKKLISNCSLLFIAEEMQMEPSALSHWIKRNIGINYDELLNYIQVEKIAEFLRNTDKSLSEIGNCVGIRYGSLVSEKFKKTTGFSPIEYKVYFGSKGRSRRKEL